MHERERERESERINEKLGSLLLLYSTWRSNRPRSVVHIGVSQRRYCLNEGESKRIEHVDILISVCTSEKNQF